MEVFIDKNFLNQVFKKSQASANDSVFTEIGDFLSKLVNVKTYINVTLPELFSNVVFKKFTNTGENLPISIPDFVNNIDDCSSLGNSSFKLFFIESDKVGELTKKYGYLFFSTSNIIDLWPRYSIRRTDLEIPISHEYIKELLNWEFLTKYHHPTRKIIVCDRYMFKSLPCVNENLVPLLQKLTRLQNESYKIEIILVGLFQDEIGRPRPIGKIYQSIKNCFPDGLSVTLSLIDAGNEFHSRGIVTSYWYINPDRSLDFIYNGHLSRNSDGNIYHGFFFRAPKTNLVKTLLKRLNEKLADGSSYVFDPIQNQRIPLPPKSTLFSLLR